MSVLRDILAPSRTKAQRVTLQLCQGHWVFGALPYRHIDLLRAYCHLPSSTRAHSSFWLSSSGIKAQMRPMVLSILIHLEDVLSIPSCYHQSSDFNGALLIILLSFCAPSHFVFLCYFHLPWPSVRSCVPSDLPFDLALPLVLYCNSSGWRHKRVSLPSPKRPRFCRSYEVHSGTASKATKVRKFGILPHTLEVRTLLLVRSNSRNNISRAATTETGGDMSDSLLV